MLLIRHRETKNFSDGIEIIEFTDILYDEIIFIDFLLKYILKIISQMKLV